MGPFSEETQMKRAEAIGRLLRDNPDIDPVYKAAWERHLKNIAYDEDTYNQRVRNIYQDMSHDPIFENVYRGFNNSGSRF